DLQNDGLSGAPVLSYLRYNVDLRDEMVKRLDPTLDDEVVESLSAMDAPANMETLHRLGQVAARRDIRPDHFPKAFDLPGGGDRDGPATEVSEEAQSVRRRRAARPPDRWAVLSEMGWPAASQTGRLAGRQRRRYLHGGQHGLCEDVPAGQS